MEREALRRTSERIALAHHQKPRRTIDELINPFGEKAYPYAWPVTYEFLKAAIEEGAHLIVPKQLRNFTDAENMWVRKRNIATIYFSSKATQGEIGRMYRYSQNSIRENPNLRSAPQKHIRTFIKLLWGNCSNELQGRFPLDQIPTDKPLTDESRYKSSVGISRAVDGVFEQALPLVMEGRWSREQIQQEVGATKSSIDHIIRNRRSRGFLPESRRYLNRKLAERFENPPKDIGLRQLLLYEADLNFYKNYRHFFVTPSECLSQAGIGVKANGRVDWITSTLKRARVPCFPLVSEERVKGKVCRVICLAILKFDQLSAVAALKDASL